MKKWLKRIRGTKLVLFALGALLMPHFAAAQDREVEMSVRNRTPQTLTVFALWDRGTRDRLGDIRGNQTRSFTIPIVGEEVTLQVQVGASRIGGNRPEDFARARPGDKIEWEIRSTRPFDLLYRHVAERRSSFNLPPSRVDFGDSVGQLRVYVLDEDLRRNPRFRALLQNMGLTWS